MTSVSQKINIIFFLHIVVMMMVLGNDRSHMGIKIMAPWSFEEVTDNLKKCLRALMKVKYKEVLRKSIRKS